MRRCSIGKNCGAACIARLKICLIDLGENFKSSLRAISDKVNKSGGIEPKFKDPGEVDAAYSKRIAKLRSLGKGKEAESLVRERELTKQRLPRVNTFLSELGKGLPEGAKAVNNGGIINITLTTRSKDKVEASFSPRLGFHFRVNGQVDPGSVKTDAGKVQSAMAAMKIFRSIVSTLPEGSVVKTRARGRDPKLTAIYRKLGFSEPTPPKGLMFAIRAPDGKVIPATQGQYESYAASAGSMFFSEASPAPLKGVV